MNIIKQIIEIDENAQKRLNAANEIKQQHLNELKEKIIEINQSLEQQTKARIDKVYATESKFAAEEKNRIDNETADVIHRLEETYKKNHVKLEQDIFNNVISI